jgi:hypothetical protein
MLYSRLLWLIPVALTLVGLGSNVKSAISASPQGFRRADAYANAIAQTTKNFDITYNTLFRLQPRQDLGEGIFRATITGESSNALYGLTNFESNTYGKLVESTETTQKFQFNADPAVFGLKNQNMLGDVYFNADNKSPNKLFGTANDMATINFANNTVMGGGEITLTGGAGIFENASGKITFTQQDQLDPTAPPGTPVVGEATLKFFVQNSQKVPEPTVSTTLVGIGVIGTGLLLRRHRNKNTFG